MEPVAHIPRPARRTRVWKKQSTRWLAGWLAVTCNTRAPFQSIPVSAINLYLDCTVGGGRGCDVNKTGQPDILYISAASKCQDEVPLAGTWQISCRPLRPDCGSGFICLSMCEGGVRDEKFGGPSPSMLFSGPSAVTPRPPGRLLERHWEFISCKAFFFFFAIQPSVCFSLRRSIGGKIEQCRGFSKQSQRGPRLQWLASVIISSADPRQSHCHFLPNSDGLWHRRQGESLFSNERIGAAVTDTYTCFIRQSIT